MSLKVGKPGGFYAGPLHKFRKDDVTNRIVHGGEMAAMIDGSVFPWDLVRNVSDKTYTPETFLFWI
jgi:hypothetical protein